MKAMKPNSVDAIVCDPPYGLEFMGKEWDKLWDKRKFGIDEYSKKSFTCSDGSTRKTNPVSRKLSNPNYKAGIEAQLWHTQWLTEAYRVLKPGGSMLVMGGTRTSHRLACAIEDTGFIIKDTLMWIYGSGFPKAQDLGKMIDKRNGRHPDNIKFRKYLKDQRNKSGLTMENINKAIGTSTMANHWFGDTQCTLPSVKQYRILKKILNLDDKFDELIEREEAERKKIGEQAGFKAGNGGTSYAKEGGWASATVDITTPSTDLAKHWDGFKMGGIKPAYEPIIWAVKPPEGSYVDNILKHGVGFVNVDATRVSSPQQEKDPVFSIYHSVYGDKCLSFLDSLSCNYAMPLSIVQDILLDIASVLKPYSNDGKDLSHNGGGQDDKKLEGVLCDILLNRLYPNGKWCGLILYEALNFQVDCQICSHFYDEQIQKIEVFAQESAPLLASALLYMSEELPKLLHSHDCQSNDHLSNEGILFHISAFIHLLLTQDATILHYINSPVKPTGRFPANVILSHHPECVQVGTKRVKGSHLDHFCTGGNILNRGAKHKKGHTDPNGYETVESWDCHPDCAVRILDEQSGNCKSAGNYPQAKRTNKIFSSKTKNVSQYNFYSDNGGASRFFYCAKASRSERNSGLKGITCTHPTVKPIKLFEWLIKLVTREGQIILDPFIGSGTTIIAAHNTGRKCVGIEKEGEYLEIAKRRIQHWENQPKQMEIGI